MSKAFFLPHGEADGLGIQGRDLNNSQMDALPKSVLLHCTMIETSQKAKWFRSTSCKYPQ